MRFHHYGLEVSELEETSAYFIKQFGFKEETRLTFMGEDIVFLILNGFRLELVSTMQGNYSNAHICFEVNNLEDVMLQFTDLRRIEGPYKNTNGWQTVFYEGPHQEIIEFLQITTT